MAQVVAAHKREDGAIASEAGDFVTILTSSRPVCKWLREGGPKGITKWTPPPEEFWLYTTVRVSCLDDLIATFKARAKGGRSIAIHGELRPGEPAIGQVRQNIVTQEVEHCYALVDIDNLAFHEADPAVAAAKARELLPPEFRQARCGYFATAGHNLPKNGVLQTRLRLFFWLSERISGTATKIWMRGCEAKPDLSIYSRVQPVFIGVIIQVNKDPAPNRWGVIEGEPVVQVPADLKERAEREPKSAEGRASVENIADLKAKIRAPENAPTLNRDIVRAQVRKQVAEVEAPDGKSEARRTLVAKAAHYIGGLLWTKAFEPEEVIHRFNGEDETTSLSLSSAYDRSGGTADNGDNCIEKGVLQCLASGALRPVVTIGGSGTDGSEFGRADDDTPKPANSNDRAGEAPNNDAPVYNFGAPIAFRGKPLADTVDVQYQAYPMFPLGMVGGLVGQGGAQKTARALVEALGVVTGRHDLLGLDKPSDLKRGSVWFHSGEDEAGHIEQRLAAAQQHFGIEDAELDGTEGHKLFLTSSAGTRWRVALKNAGKVTVNTEAVEHAVAFVKENDIKLAIVDPAVELHDANENDNGEMAVVFSAFRRIASESGCHVLVVIHSGKPDKASSAGIAGNQHAARGASSQSGSLRFMRTLAGMSEAEAVAYDIPPERRLRYSRADDAKANHSAKRTEPTWFESVSVSPGPGRHSVLVSAPVMLVKGPKPKPNETAEAVAAILREIPFKPNTAFPVVDVIETVGIGGDWPRSHRMIYFKRVVLGDERATSCKVEGGKLVVAGGKGIAATVALVLEDTGFGPVNDE